MKRGRGKSFLLALALLALLLALVIFSYKLTEPTPIDSHTEFAYVPNAKSHNVSVINTTTNQIEYNVPVGNDTEGVAVNWNGTKVYLTNGILNIVSVIDTATNKVIATIPVGVNPMGVAVTPDGKKVFVANYYSNNVSVIDTETNRVKTWVNVQTNPLGVAVNWNGTKVYVANYNSGTVSEIDTATYTVRPIPVGFNPYGVAVNPNGTKLYVTHDNSNIVSVIDTATYNVIPIVKKDIDETIEKVQLSPHGVVVNPNGTKVYVANRRVPIKGTSTTLPGSVSVIDTATNSVTATVNLEEKCPTGVSINKDGTKLYVANACSNTVSVIDTATNSVTATVPVGNKPYALGQFIVSPPKVPAHKIIPDSIDHVIKIITQNEVYIKINEVINGVEGFVLGIFVSVFTSHIKLIFEKTSKPILDIFDKTLELIYKKISELRFRKKYKK